MKPQTGAQRHLDRGSEMRVSQPALQSGPSAELSDQQTRVLQCLEEAGTGLTVHQLESKLATSPESLREVLDLLVESRLVVRLNTIIPTYARRIPDYGVHAE